MPEIFFKEIIIAFLFSFIYVASFVFFYKSLIIGPVSIISPIATSYGMIAVVLSVAFLGEVLTLKQILAIILVVLGIIFTSTNLKEVF